MRWSRSRVRWSVEIMPRFGAWMARFTLEIRDHSLVHSWMLCVWVNRVKRVNRTDWSLVMWYNLVWIIREPLRIMLGASVSELISNLEWLSSLMAWWAVWVVEWSRSKVKRLWLVVGLIMEVQLMLLWSVLAQEEPRCPTRLSLEMPTRIRPFTIPHREWCLTMACSSSSKWCSSNSNSKWCPDKWWCHLVRLELWWVLVWLRDQASPCWRDHRWTSSDNDDVNVERE